MSLKVSLTILFPSLSADAAHMDLSFEAFGEVGTHGGRVIFTAFRPIGAPGMGRGVNSSLAPRTRPSPAGTPRECSGPRLGLAL